ncbi:MAG: 3'(2'),5'-bisphosphate nucleotidase CysQ [Alistipes sp.]|nr:3'(2'),5'-bisphosphate nucleotidase CysQ [Alistipes sp.]
MLDNEQKIYLLPNLINAAVRAGAAIMQVYDSPEDYGVSLKNDKTPITVADRRAHDTIKNYLGPTRIPILSEEGREMRYEERCNWELFWLVDPLDGTVEFIKGNNEFTVNIALMENNRSVAAAVYVPYLRKLYLAWRGGGAFLKEEVVPDAGADYTYEQLAEGLRPLPSAETRHERFRVAVSRSHQSPETHAYIDELRRSRPDLQVMQQGSSYKFCLLAEGTVDCYVRTTPTYEWDTAAGELILEEAGGQTLSLPGHGTLAYNKEDLRNPWFVCGAAGVAL